MTSTPKIEPDFDQIEADLRQRLGELEDRRQVLALDTLTDSKARACLESAEHDLGSVQAELGRLTIARGEQERREIAAKVEAQTAAEQRALAVAEKIGATREQEAAAFDRAAVEFVRRARNYAAACDAQALALQEANRPRQAAQARSIIGYRIESALAFHLRRSGKTSAIPRDQFLERLPLIAEPHKVPLAASERDIRPLPPADSDD